MERIQVLIDKLQQQKRSNESVAQMMITVQLLQNELISLQKENKVFSTSKVAVVMPASAAMPAQVAEPVNDYAKNVDGEKPSAEVFVDTKPSVPEVIEIPAKKEEYRLPRPVVAEPVQEQPGSVHANMYETHFEAQEAPTLIQQQIHREVHDLISEPKESLNDRLKQQKTELAHLLKETPIKDLRKGIGVNDKFTFINELFRGDEAMYERSIKTINGFHILQEAEYWMNRELKVKLGWNDGKDTVQYFYQLVRRRFA